jgi:phosphoribosylanthranilate isomerase
MTRVKICGCMRAADAIAAADAGADFIGIMFAADSRRRMSLDEAAAIARAVGEPLRDVEQDEPPPLHPGRFDSVDAWFAHGARALERLLARKRPLVVGVFANQPIDEVNETADEVGLDLVQLSGNEPWSDALLLTRQAVKVVHQLPGMSAADVRSSLESDTAIACMLDASSGTGTEGEWAVAGAVAAKLPIWLAGGLRPQNVEEAVRIVQPWAVDVSTGVETDGAKDREKIAAFVRAAKGVTV